MSKQQTTRSNSNSNNQNLNLITLLYKNPKIKQKNQNQNVKGKVKRLKSCYLPSRLEVWESWIEEEFHPNCGSDSIISWFLPNLSISFLYIYVRICTKCTVKYVYQNRGNWREKEGRRVKIWKYLVWTEDLMIKVEERWKCVEDTTNLLLFWVWVLSFSTSFSFSLSLSSGSLVSHSLSLHFGIFFRQIVFIPAKLRKIEKGAYIKIMLNSYLKCLVNFISMTLTFVFNVITIIP